MMLLLLLVGISGINSSITSCRTGHHRRIMTIGLVLLLLLLVLLLLLQRIIRRLRIQDRAKRPDAVEEIRPWVVDRHARVVRILSPTLGGRRAQIIPDLLLPAHYSRWDPDMACSVHRLEFGPLVPSAKRTACHRD